MGTRFFRAGVGTVIFNNKKEVVLFERAKYPVGIWQFQQGGIDLDENPESTLWRELLEEVGLTNNDFDFVHEMPNWTLYTEQEAINNPNKPRFGQCHKWYFLKIKEDRDIDLSKALEDEASDYRWTDFSSVVSETDELKKHVYRELQTYFNEVVLKLS